MSAQQMQLDGVRTSGFRAVTAGTATFLQTYVLRGGFLDGIPGIYIAYFAAQNTFLKHAILSQLQGKLPKK